MLIALCGLAFSGKSTIARRLAAELPAELISYDAINAERGFDGGKMMDDREWEKTSFEAASRAASCLAAGRSVVVDDTFSHRFLRERFRKVASSAGTSFVVLFVDTPIEAIEARIAENARTGRRAHILPDVFAHHRARFQFPDADEQAERIASEADVDAWLGRRR